MMAKKAEAGVIDVNEQEKQLALTDYDKLLRDVTEMKTMTDTAAWQRLYASLRRKIAAHAEDVLEAEKPREVVQHQEGVKILRDVCAWPAAPVQALKDFVKGYPLFAGEMNVRAEWNEVLGRIDLTEIKG